MPDLTMTRGARLAAIGLLVLTLLVGGGNLWATRDEVGAVQAASARAERATATISQLCQSGNEFRAQQVSLWEYILHLGKKPQTAAQRRITAQFDHHLHVIFAPRSCAHLGQH